MEAYSKSQTSKKLLGDILLEYTNIKDEKIFYSILNMTIMQESCLLANDVNIFLNENIIKHYYIENQMKERLQDKKEDVIKSKNVVNRRIEENPEMRFSK